MKNILNDITREEKNSIIGQYTNKLNVKVENFKKLTESKLGDSKPLINEQKTPEEAGYKEYSEINLPDGTYLGNINPSDNVKEGLRHVRDVLVYDKDRKFTGYVLQVQSPSRSGHDDITFEIKNKKVARDGFFIEDKYFFKDQGYAPAATQAATQEKAPQVTNKVASEGIKNVLPEMIAGKPFEGYYSGYVFGGIFNGTDYLWDCNGVEGMNGVRGMVDGKIISENNSMLNKQTKMEITDADPKGVWVGFYSKGDNFVVYMTTAGQPKCVYF